MTENSQDASQVTGSAVQAPNYSEFETLYESVLFKKPELVTGKVFVNTMNELKLMKNSLEVPGLEKEFAQIDELMVKLYVTVQPHFSSLDKEQLAKLLINIKDKLQSKKPQESVGKIGKIIGEYLQQIIKETAEKEAKHDGKKKAVKEKKINV
ncbi:hypothetical protein M8J77_007828 [Diaphorina citri]|nr:hypothetical protein M8J77_007828 [Diaphorina citri]